MVMGCLLRYKYEDGYCVWIPKMGVKKVQDVVFYDNHVPILPEDGVMMRCKVQPANLLPAATWPAAAGPQ